MKFKVYVTTSEIPESAIDILETTSEVVVNQEPRPPSREILLKEVEDADGVLCLVTERMDKEVMQRAHKLKVIANMAVGFDNIDLNEATMRSIRVTNTPEVLTETTADLAMAIILAVARRIPEADHYVRTGKWVVPWSPMLMVGSDVHGKILGIYGLGRIGKAVARRARGFDMRLMYFDRARNTEFEREAGIEFVSLERLFSMSDYVTVHVPLTPETRHSVGREALALMKKSAFLINTARGAIVDEVALVKALQEGKIAGAALDVFEKEPINRNNPLLRLSNVVLAPHVGSASFETRIAMANLAARNIIAVLKGDNPPNLVNPAVISVE